MDYYYLSHGLAGWARVASSLLEVQLAGNLDFRAESTTTRGETVKEGWWAETEASLCLGAVLEWTARVTATTTVLIAIQLGGVARDHTWQTTTCLACVAWRCTTAKESSIEIGRS